MSRFDYVHGAIAVAEREHWPRLGLSTTRRSLNLVARALTNEKVQCLACFVCGQLRNTIAGLTPFDERIPLEGARKPRHAEISYWDRRKFQQLESTSQGTLLNNCSYDLWRKRYVKRDDKKSSKYPWRGHDLATKPLSSCAKDRARHISHWVIEMTFQLHTARLFGCTEDIRCTSSSCSHKNEFEILPFSGASECMAAWLIC